MNNISATNPDRNKSVDSFRLFAALCVIVLHLEYPSLPSNIVIGLRLLCRWAIPFFFIISGYYFAAQNQNLKEMNIQKMAGRLIWVFLLWSIIYIPVILDQHDLKAVLQRFFTPNFIYFGSFIHLWFISSLIFGYLFIAFCYQFNLKYILIFSSLAFIILVLLSTSYPIFKAAQFINLETASTALSVPFLCIGFYFYKKRFPSWWISLLLVVSGIIIQMLEVQFIYHTYGLSAYDHEFLMGTIPFAIGMAAFALNNLKWFGWPVISSWGRDYSLGIYLIHLLVIHVTAKFISSFLFEISAAMLWQVIWPLIILALCIFIFEITHRYTPKLFNFLYGKHDRI